MAAMWKEDWARCRENLGKWWRREGPAVCLVAPKDVPWAELPRPDRPGDELSAWTDPVYRARRAEYEISRNFYGGEAFPHFDAHVGPGSLGMILGAEPEFTTRTVWYRPCIEDPETYPPVRFDPDNRWLKMHIAMLDEGRRVADGRFLVTLPDLIENVDTLAQMRDSQTLLLDMIERPEWIERSMGEINRAFFEVFDAMYAHAEFDGGNAFSAFRIWGPGKTAKLQCDASAMFSPQMFRRFVVPALREQCQWLDYSLYHLDGTQALCHLDALLEIEELDAIQWTPQTAMETSGHPRWYDVYRRILKAGKSVQGLWMEPDHVLPLLDAVGAEGVFVHALPKDESAARRMLDRVERYRPKG
jgi:hypothetical protein